MRAKFGLMLGGAILTLGGVVAWGQGFPELPALTGAEKIPLSYVTPPANLPVFTDPNQITTYVIAHGGGGGTGCTVSGGAGAVANNGSTGCATVTGTDGQIVILKTGLTPVAASVGGDGTLSVAGALTVTKTNGTAFTALATTTPGANVATWLATPSGANLASALTTALPESKGGTGQTSLVTALNTDLIPTNGNCITGNGGGTAWVSAACPGGGGSGTVNSGTTPQAAYYASSAAAVSGASGVLFPGQVAISVGSPTGSSPGAGVVDVATGFQVNGVAVGQVVAGTSQTVSAAQWTAGTTFVVTSAGQTLTLPASSTLSANGGIIIQTVGVSAALAPNGSDTINGVNTTKTIGAGVSSVVTTNAAGAIDATPTAAGSPPFATGWIATANPNKAVLGTADRAYRISSIVGRVSDAAGTAATVAVYKAPSGTACSAGTILHSGTMDANGTANTNQTLSLVGGATDDLAAGDSVCLVTTGTTAWTAGTAIGGVTVSMSPL